MSKFRYWNENPQGEKKSDCVTRAITLACNLPYPTVRRKLYHSAKLLDCSKLCCNCYANAIQNALGGMPVNCEGITVGEFADLHPIGIYLIRIEGHLTALIDNCIYDIWDCRDRLCSLAWKMPNY
jgi:hypothetical protein